MTFDDYQKQALSISFYPGKGNNFVYPALGLSGESGEVAEKVKKILRDKHGVMNDADKQAMCKELGDVLWYVTAMAAEIGSSLAGVAEANLDKLISRKDRGVLGGSGDDR